MQSRSTPGGPAREIACDESGYEGEKLVDGETDVFAHAGVDLTTGSAASCIVELRRRIRSPALEYKANHLLREKHRPVLEWLLGPSGPIHDRARVHLVDKTFLLVRTVVALFAGAGTAADPQADAMARTLYHEGRHKFGRENWAAFLAAANDLMWTRNRPEARARLDTFLRTVDVLRVDASSEADDVLGLLRPTGPRVESIRAQLLQGPGTIPALDPLVPAIVRTVLHWSGDGTVPVSVVHDRQTALTDERIAHIRELLGGRNGRLAGVRLVGSRSDPRVQVADFLAGVARKVASYELADRGDAELVALLRPYVDPSSIWGDARSWSLLGPAGGTR